MVHDRLHLICGSCGCNDEWEWEYIEADIDKESGEVVSEATVYLWCTNCSTLHALYDNAKPRKR